MSYAPTAWSIKNLVKLFQLIEAYALYEVSFLKMVSFLFIKTV